jgi:hypothetical protein
MLQVDEAFGVTDTLAGLGIDLTEAEFAALLHVCQFAAGWGRAEALLRRIGRELTTLSTVRPFLKHVWVRYWAALPQCASSIRQDMLQTPSGSVSSGTVALQFVSAQCHHIA